MNFKEAFDNDCNKITASDELINRTLMAAITQEGQLRWRQWLFI